MSAGLPGVHPALAGGGDGADGGRRRVAYLLTGKAGYLQFSWRVFRYALLVALLVFALMVLERVAVIPL